MAEAKAWGLEVEGDSGTLVIAAANALSAVAVLAERKLAENLGDPVWIKLARDTAQAAHDAHAKVVALDLEARRTRMAERDADRLAAAIADGLQEAFGDLATAERRAVFARVVSGRVRVFETQAADVPGLPAAA